MAGMALIMIISLSITGATLAWFTSEDETPGNIFTAGIVRLSEPIGAVSKVRSGEVETKTADAPEKQSPSDFVYSDDLAQGENDQVVSPAEYVYSDDLFINGDNGLTSPAEGVYEKETDEQVTLKTVAPTCKKVVWTFQNSGSKDAYVRVRPYADQNKIIYIAVHLAIGGETAFVGVNRSSDQYLPLPGHQFGQYLAYPLGVYTAGSPLSLNIWAGNNFMNYGTAKIWDDGTDLFIEINANQERIIKDLHIYAGLMPPTHSNPGHFGWNEGNPNQSQYTFSTSTIYPYQPVPGQTKPQADILLSSLYNSHTIGVDITLCPDYEEYWQEKDGWWYYGTSSGPINVVKNGGEVIVCFRYCYPSTSDDITLRLEAQAVQSSHQAYQQVWSGMHPW
jgi:predicted ribosomally synthesized peptide with SipW-like signal peptide